MLTSLFLIGTNFGIAGVQCLSEGLVHAHGIIPLNKVDLVAMARNEVINLLIVCTSQNSWTRDFIPVEVENRQNGPIAHGVQEVNALPGPFQRRSLSLSISND